MPGFYCTDQQLVDFIGATINTDSTVPDMTSASLLKRIQPIALDIKKKFKDQRITSLAEVEPVPVDNRFLITETLNLIEASRQMFTVKTGDISIELRKLSKTFNRIRDFLWYYFENRTLLQLWVKAVVPTTALCVRADCYINTAGAKDNTELKLGITNDILDRLILRVGAFVRARALMFKNYPQVNADFTSDQALCYREQTAGLTRVFHMIAFARSKGIYSEDVDRVVNDWLDEIENQWYEFDMGLKHNIFKVA